MGRPRAPVDVALGDGGPWVADAAEGRLVALTGRLGFRRTVPLPGASPLAVLPSRRRELPTLYVADGEGVREIGLPVPSPVPVLDSLKSRLGSGDREGALELIHPVQRRLFDRIYSVLTAEELAADAEAMEAFSVDLLRPERAIVRIEALEYRGEQAIPRLFPVHLVRMQDGSWRIFDY